MSLVEFFGPQILTTKGLAPTDEALSGKKVIALYFAGYWCPPCRRFTPIVSRMHEDIVEEHSDIEFVFISYDRDHTQFDDYWGDYMTFPALPYEARDKKTELGKRFNITSIPTLIFLDADTKKIITTSGVELVESGIDEQDYVRSIRTALGLDVVP
ncbi:unnamed protein product [Aphanomyces euteiches]|uniref:Thioredoxin domain-containing protein n=1 Tax=Aphanomyces euteiches TaxID=100861 RepID=A0A6G0XXU4_9STRA|nr:hypothetical protein Ae201684_000033 [Aphanomyces euteiches]KAH9051759.1 hypothetical protein Ae201684P_015597 [Aphanomyces euteiches]KAH9120801.1 hypothetical protein LEN26_010958 [Aphanomyces euteiches]KAH9125179.1 hypothetical protein AeMF1_004166 [Aphanomyces euteiches]KAH9139420.1 hypothetical protein AeRB84_016298 [Aphanomyces euteiches]